MEKETAAGVRVGLWWCIGCGAVIALIAGMGVVPAKAIVCLVALGGIGLSLAAFEHGWLHGIRGIIVFVAIWAGVVFVGYKVWPPREILKVTPEIVWVPASLQEGQPLGQAQLNASATVDSKEVKGRAVYDPALGATLVAGTQTLRVDFTFDDEPYNPVSKAVAVEVLPKPKPHTLPQPPTQSTSPPIILKGSPFVGKRGEGGYAQLTIELQNKSGKVLNIVSAKGSSIAPIFPNDSARQTQVEDALWNGALNELNSEPDYESISTGEDGNFYRIMRTKPFTPQADQLITEGKYAPYFYVVIEDRKSKESIFEFCGWIDEDSGVRQCHGHQKP